MRANQKSSNVGDSSSLGWSLWTPCVESWMWHRFVSPETARRKSRYPCDADRNLGRARRLPCKEPMWFLRKKGAGAFVPCVLVSRIAFPGVDRRVAEFRARADQPPPLPASGCRWSIAKANITCPPENYDMTKLPIVIYNEERSTKEKCAAAGPRGKRFLTASSLGTKRFRWCRLDAS